ncbi:MAG: hypothetical protein Kow0029_07750 [Candidatus Rifleibacteriota bacterium]
MEKTFKSGLTKPGIWLFIFVFFAIIPLIVFLECYKTYLESDFIASRERTIKYYQRELTAFRSKATNKQIFLQLFQSFRDSCRKNIPNSTHKNLELLEELRKEIPKETNFIFWNSSGEIIASFTILDKGIENKVTPDQIQQFVDLLLNSNSDFSSGANLQTLHQAKVFEMTNRDFFASIAPLIGKNFQATQAFTNRNAMTGDYLDASEVFFFWDFINNKDNSQGGFAAIIPRRNLSPTYALSGVLAKDPTANPEFTNGFFDYTTEIIEISYKELMPIVKEMVEGYKNGVSNPYIKGDWVLFVQSITDSSSANIFSLFSLKSLRERFESSVYSANVVCILIGLCLAFLFFHMYKTTMEKGLSLRKKMAWLFLFCMQLPISILIFLGIQFSLSKERLLSIEADTNLIELVKKVDFSAQDYYRTLTEWIKTFKYLPELKALNKEELHKKFFNYARNKQLQSFYVVGMDGNIEFDIDNLNSESGNRLFIRELGVKILAHYSGNNENTFDDDSDSISGGFMDQVIKKLGILHQVVWPGSNSRKFIFTDVIQSDNGKVFAIIAALDKAEVDRNYLKIAITNQYKNNPDHELIIINKNDISDSIPKLSPTFKANLLPMLSTARISNTVETDKITDGRDALLVALTQGNYVSDFLIGAKAKWNKIVESIRQMYLLVIIGLILSLTASLILITVLLREFLTPISILSSGAKAIINGDLDLDLPVFAKDELGDLSKTFNFMTKRLKNRLTELTVLYNMTQKASTSHNQREVFDLAAENLLKHLNAESHGTAWINQGEGNDSVYLTEHHAEELDETIRNIVKVALQNFKSHLEYSEKIAKYVLAIPLYFEEKKFGAIYLTFSKDRFAGNQTFSEDEKSFIETLRHHLSLIIEKQRLFEQAITDGLTKLYVRRFFLTTLEKEVARSKRYQLDVAVLLIDIDHFKKFNDTYGHQAGDHVLKETAQRIVECVRAVDTPGRYGGEEMSVLLPQTNIKEAFIVAERIKKAIEGSEYNYRDKVMKVTVSIGASALHNRQISTEELIEEADKALYKAKENGRNQVRIAPEAM